MDEQLEATIYALDRVRWERKLSIEESAREISELTNTPYSVCAFYLLARRTGLPSESSYQEYLRDNPKARRRFEKNKRAREKEKSLLEIRG